MKSSQNELSANELESLLKIHVSRARSRIEGLKYFEQLLRTTEFSSARQQIIALLTAPLAAGHYLDNISACGPELTSLITEAFVVVFNRIMQILRDSSSDAATRLLGLTMYSVAYKHTDVEFLRTSKVFRLLQQIIADCNQKLQQAHSKQRSPRPPAVLEKTKGEEQQRRQQEREEKEDMERQRALRKAAWTAFRLLATLCVTWDIDHELNLTELQDEIFELMCSELKVMSEQVVTHYEEDSNQCFELLSLLCLLGSSPKGHRYTHISCSSISSQITLQRR